MTKTALAVTAIDKAERMVASLRFSTRQAWDDLTPAQRGAFDGFEDFLFALMVRMDARADMDAAA